ncbi:MAG TPA: hypothetical protein ENN94_04400 [Geoalkalibacter subterraneus]|uniref:Carboxypeptidase regulatory-like domain-containing protein n=1 Tax=Geoalkalibacter subterraneus TaxID=483547 RepID=A0A831PHJ1_9BACT|nr:hypothetical protein [Geoalkalibacter subterraneus]
MRFYFLLFLFFLFSLPATAAQQPPQGSVKGRVAVGDDIGEMRGVAALWDVASGKEPDPRKYILVPAAVVPLSADGHFELKATPGEYYLGSIVRATAGPVVGPPRPGDRVMMSPDAQGRSLKIQIEEGKTLDVGLQQGGWIYEGFAPEAELALKGVVRDVNGDPVSGLLVFAFADAAMSTQPVAVSDRTGEDGVYLRLNRSRPVFLRARESYGGGPLAGGGYVGVYGGHDPQAVTPPGKGVMTGLDIEVLRLPPAGNRGQGRPEGPPQ